MLRTFVVTALLLAACGDDNAAPTTRKPLLVDVGEEPPGPNCAAGGSYIARGLDGNDDAVLDATEVTHTSYVCVGSPLERQALVVSTEEPAGENCTLGGYKIESGTDDDEDGALDGDEIDATDYACSPDPGVDPLTLIHFGDFTIHDADDLAYVAGLRIVTGNLRTNLLGDVSVAGVVTVGGTLYIDNCEALGAPMPTTLSYPDLERAGSIQLAPGCEGDDTLTAVSFPALATVNQNISITSALAQFDFDAPVLELVGTFSLYKNEGLASLTLPAVRTLNYLEVTQNIGLTTLTLPELEVMRNVYFYDNPDLSDCLEIELHELVASINSEWEISYNNNGVECVEP